MKMILSEHTKRPKMLLLLLVLSAYCYILMSMFITANTKKTISQSPDGNTSIIQGRYQPEGHLKDKPSATNVQYSENKMRSPFTDQRSPFIDPIVLRNVSNEAEKHIILHWNSPPWLIVWSLNVDLSSCNYKNCRLMHDRSVFHQSSLVVFNLPQSELEDKPPVDPEHRNPNQVWAFFTEEAPPHTTHIKTVSNSHWQNMFNWSWTYKPSSDIFQPYGILQSRESPLKRNYSEIFHKKKKFAAWAVSNCDTQGKREQYVEVLRKYVDIDIYGKCGTFASVYLETLLNENYKFYLGFENSLCADYMSEKFFHYYSLDIITVLRGSVNYTEYLPEGSFIDTANFSSITALAKFMLDVGSNEDQYVEYLKIKDKYTVREAAFMYGNALCIACEKLNNLEEHRNMHSDPGGWLGPCHHVQDIKEDPSIKLPTVHGKNTLMSPISILFIGLVICFFFVFFFGGGVVGWGVHISFNIHQRFAHLTGIPRYLAGTNQILQKRLTASLLESEVRDS